MQTSSANPLLLAGTRDELEDVAAEMKRLLLRRPTDATRARSAELRRRFEVLTRTQRGLACEELALRVAFRERAGRNPDDDDAYTEADLQRASEILTIFGLRVSER